jgi:hypothetical protein
MANNNTKTKCLTPECITLVRQPTNNEEEKLMCDKCFRQLKDLELVEESRMNAPAKEFKRTCIGTRKTGAKCTTRLTPKRTTNGEVLCQPCIRSMKSAEAQFTIDMLLSSSYGDDNQGLGVTV